MFYSGQTDSRRLFGILYLYRTGNYKNCSLQIFTLRSKHRSAVRNNRGLSQDGGIRPPSGGGGGGGGGSEPAAAAAESAARRGSVTTEFEDPSGRKFSLQSLLFRRTRLEAHPSTLDPCCLQSTLSPHPIESIVLEVQFIIWDFALLLLSDKNPPGVGHPAKG